MDEEKSRLFSFRYGLYNISNKLSALDLEKIKFMLSDFLPRQQLEKTRTGFDVLCLMASRKDLLSPHDTSFLEEVLREVGKSDYVRDMLAPQAASMLPKSGSTANTPVSQYQRPKLLEMKKLLGEVCDNLSSENVNDLCQFFVGICESINYQNYHKIKSAEELFSRLQESHLLGLGDLQLLQCILRLLGRLDLAALVEAFVSGTWRSACNLPGIPTPEEESNQDGDKVFPGCSLPSNESAEESLPEVETDLGYSVQQLLFKIEDRERKLETQEAELVALRKQVLKKEEFEHEDQQLLRGALEMKTGEVKSLHDSLMKLQELLWKNDNVPLYAMTQNPHGFAVIIVNGTFHSTSGNQALKQRKGAGRDIDCFERTFSFLHYAIRVYSDLSAADMQSLMQQMGSSEHSSFDSFVCCVSSHGNQDGIYGSDGIVVARNAFIDPIKSCSSLAGKPKMFFFQACRVPPVSADSPGTEMYKPYIPTTTLHCDADILIANASTEGSPAYTSPETGSWFANGLLLKLTDPQLVYVRTLQQSLEEVTDFVSQAEGQLPTGERVNQCVEVTTRMRKGVKFL